MNIRILCQGHLNHCTKARQILESVGELTCAEYDYPQLADAIEEYDALIPSLGIYLDENLLRQAGRLKLIATPSTGTDHIDLESAKRLGIQVASLKNDYRFLKTVAATAELALGLMLSIVRRIPFAFDSVRESRWERQDFCGHELLDKILGIIGYGRLGEMVARYGHALGMTVLAYDPHKSISESYVTQVGLQTLLGAADVITIHVHLNEETRGMLSALEFSLMKQGAYLVNTSRGAVINEAEMIKALESGRLAGAAVDVISGELQGNLDIHPLVQYARCHDNLIITPHIGGVTYDSQAKAYAFTARKVQAFFQGTI